MMGEAAVAYVERLGFAVFGTAPDCRTPLKREGWYEHGCRDATKDVGEARRRWAADPTANVSIATGDPSGVFVLDIDRKGAVDGFEGLSQLESLFSPLPPTWRSRTPSGGEHRWFRKPQDRALINRVGLKVHHHDGGCLAFPGLDIRTTGGSVAAPPSRRATGAYAWIDKPSQTPLADAPDWLLQIIDPPPAAPREPREPLRMSGADKVAKYVVAAINGEFDALAKMAAGSGRNLRLFQASANLGEFVGAGLVSQATVEDVLERAAAENGLLQEDGAHAVRATIASGMKRGLANPREVTL